MTQSECLPGPSVLCFNGAQIQMLTFTCAPGVCRLGPHLDSDQKTSFFFFQGIVDTCLVLLDGSRLSCGHVFLPVRIQIDSF